LAERADNINDSARTLKGQRTWRKNEWRQTMSDLRDKGKKKIDDAGDAVKNAADKVVDKSKAIARSAGKKMKEGGERLQDA
jgi:hypothetical protein